MRLLHQEGLAEVQRPPDYAAILGQVRVARAIDFRALEVGTAAQVHGGVDADGLVAPYASMILACGGGRRLRLEGAALARPVLAGARVAVFADEEPLGELELEPGAPLEQVFELPPALGERPFLSVRLRASDYVYAGQDLRTCAAFRLDRVAIEK